VARAEGHLLLGLIQDEHGAAGRVLVDLHIPLSEARIHTERIVPELLGRAADEAALRRALREP
jgi:hypothetical protein